MIFSFIKHYLTFALKPQSLNRSPEPSSALLEHHLYTADCRSSTEKMPSQTLRQVQHHLPLVRFQCSGHLTVQSIPTTLQFVHVWTPLHHFAPPTKQTEATPPYRRSKLLTLSQQLIYQSLEHFCQTRTIMPCHRVPTV